MMRKGPVDTIKSVVDTFESGVESRNDSVESLIVLLQLTFDARQDMYDLRVHKESYAKLLPFTAESCVNFARTLLEDGGRCGGKHICQQKWTRYGPL